jgi:AcrR family transcriptional regulator
MTDAQATLPTDAPVSGPRRGRRPAASREDVLAAASYRYLRGRRVDVQAIAAELGLGRTTIYRWFGSRDELIGEVIAAAAAPLLADARRRASGRGGPALLDTFDRFNRSLAAAPALRQFVENESEAALRVITSGAGRVQPRMVAMITGLIAAEVNAGRYTPPVEISTLGYAIVRLAEAFLFNDAVSGMRGDVDRLRDVEAAILGVAASRKLSPPQRRG